MSSILFSLLFPIVASDPLLFEGFPTPFNDWIINNPWTKHDSEISVFLGSYKLSSVPISADGKTTYDFHHASLVFSFQDEWISLDLSMENPLDIGSMFVPTESGWTNKAAIHIELSSRQQAKFESLVSVGETNGEELFRVIAHIFQDFTNSSSPFRYDVFTIVNERGQIIRSARSCFEFVESIISRMRIKLSNNNISYFRDTVFIRVSNVVIHTAPHPDESVAQFNHFASILIPELFLIARHLVYLRVVFAKFFFAHQNWWFAGLENDDMWEVTLSEEFTDNGCKELVTLVAENDGEFGQVHVVRSGWTQNATRCALPYQKMNDLRQFVTVANNMWTIGVYVSLGVIILTGLLVRSRRKLVP